MSVLGIACQYLVAARWLLMGVGCILLTILTVCWSLPLKPMGKCASEIQYCKPMCPCIQKPNGDLPCSQSRSWRGTRLASAVGKARCTSPKTLSPVSMHQLHQGQRTIVSAAVEMVTSSRRLSVVTRSGRCAILQQRYHGVVLEMADECERDTCSRT